MKHATSRVLFSYWDTLRGERAAPERGEVEPGSIRHVLADTFILETGLREGARFRLAGTRLCALFGRELRDESFEALWQEPKRHEIRRHLDVVADEMAGLVIGVSGRTVAEETISLELLLLPLRHRGDTHARVLGAISPGAVPYWIGLRHVTGLETTSLRIIWPSGRTDRRAFAANETPLDRRRQLVVHQGGRA